MSKFQTLSVFINLGGDRDNVVHRIPEDPVTYPEMIVLRTIHGGEDHVYGLVEVGSVDRDDAVERERLALKYGKIVSEVFPGAIMSLPAGDTSIPTLAEVAEANGAAKEILSRPRKAGKIKKPEAAETAVPDLAADDNE
jgi:hypothetical protein